MKKFINSKLILLIPAYWACLFDIIITTLHQPEEYWKGNLDNANEGNPIGAFFMTNHTYGLFLISILWLIAIAVISHFLKKRKFKIFALFVLIAHTFGASSWLNQKYGFWFALSFILINSILFIEFENIYKKRKAKN